MKRIIILSLFALFILVAPAAAQPVGPTPTVGTVLVAPQAVFSGSLTPTNGVTYQWKDCNANGGGCQSIVGANASTYTVTTADVGHALRTSVDTVSAYTPVAIVAAPPVPPKNTAAPTIAGTPQQGDQLTASTGTWSGDTPMTFTYLWSDGTAGQTDVLPSGDVGKTVSVTVTASNDASPPTVSATSAAVGPVTNPVGPPPATGQSVAFYLGWVGGSITGAPWNAITQMDMFALVSCTTTVNSNCPTAASLNSSMNSVPTGAALASWVGTVHANHRLAFITVGGSTNPNWSYACAPGVASTFAQNLVNYAVTNGFDGIDWDEEQDTGGAFTTAELTACISSIYQDAHAATSAAGKPIIVSADLNPTYEQDLDSTDAPYVDQVNEMLYGSNSGSCSGAGTCPSYASGTATLNRLGIPTSKIVAGLSVPESATFCGQVANYASTNGLMGSMVWYLQGDSNYACLDAQAPYVAPPGG